MSKALLDQVKSDLQKALEVELFTLPPYLTALYSMRDGGNADSKDVIQSVSMEEMLHIILVSNILNALGGKPCFDTSKNDVKKRFYPAKIPHINIKQGPMVNLKVSLSAFSKKTIEQFAAIEAPDFEIDSHASNDNPGTIGAFYQNVAHALIRLCPDGKSEKKIFSGDPRRQIHPDQYYYGAGGKAIVVSNLATALEAIEEISEQGEGRKKLSILSGNEAKFGQPKETAHYYRFRQIIAERKYRKADNILGDPQGDILLVDWLDVYPAQDNPTEKNVPAGIRKDFDQCYSDLLKHLETGLGGHPESLDLAIADMHALRHHVQALMRIPVPGKPGRTYGPPFWFVERKP